MFLTQMFHKETTDEDNVEIRTMGRDSQSLILNPKAHWDIGTDLRNIRF